MRGERKALMQKLVDLVTLWSFSLLFEGAVQLLRKLRGGRARHA